MTQKKNNALRILPKYSRFEAEYVCGDEYVTLKSISDKHGLIFDSFRSFAHKKKWAQKKKEFREKVNQALYESQFLKQVDRKEKSLQMIMFVLQKLYEKIKDETIELKSSDIWQALKAWRDEAGEPSEKISITVDALPNLTDEQLQAIIDAEENRKKLLR